MCFIVRFIIKQVVCWFWCSNISKSNSHICSSVRRILEQWDCICSFVKDLGKDPITTPKNVAYKRVSAMWNDEEGKKTKAQQEFVGNVSPVFEDFLTIFQNSCPQVHLLYDKMSEFLRMLMGRFLKRDAYENFGSDLVSIDCSANSQLPDADIAIGEATKKALSNYLTGLILYLISLFPLPLNKYIP